MLGCENGGLKVSRSMGAKPNTDSLLMLEPPLGFWVAKKQKVPKLTQDRPFRPKSCMEVSGPS